MSNESHAYRARILHFVDNPLNAGDQAWQYFEDGILWVENGYIRSVGHAVDQLMTLPTYVSIDNYSDHLIIPGFIDTHIHYPQIEMIGAYGEQLLTWLNNYTFPTESQFGDSAYAARISSVFTDELLRNGTTTALVFGTVHPASVNAFFSEAQQRGLRMIAGKVMMDRNAPEEICDTPETGYHHSKRLIERWHGVDRLQYAITPRFAPTSSYEQLEKIAYLFKQYQGLYMHTHLSENTNEVAWALQLFPEATRYLDIYDNYGLLTPRSVFAHGVHLCDEECRRLAETGSSIAHCPTSNLFLGSGLINLNQLFQHGVSVGLGTDIGGGTSFSMFKTMDEAYKIQQLRGATLDPFQALYMATLGGAKALDLDTRIGSFRLNNEADFVILDLQATPLLKFRTPYCKSLRDLLFVLNTLGDDRVVKRTYSLGRCVHNRDGATHL
ncbi:guanine deaminase [Ketobacter sp. MCCC 1A13808]|uniref:guanine deaminase n=1 Tax=Ketobacter sp. MCCC 1A13808 TaxID=2602738 RepID=UPI0012EB3A06|nr:guanine deaminase [Ketobacter sp. MCCC 1A13808]MVF12060.1 guanine deaminase [Ketobacter sp. MCCC 1A13808]